MAFTQATCEFVLNEVDGIFYSWAAAARMSLGINLNWLSTYDYTVQYANIVYQGGKWRQDTGSGTWAQSRGTLTADTATDEFRMALSGSGKGMPTGTYTVLNPDGCEIGVGNSSTKNLLAYTTSTQTTFVYTTGNPIILWSKGSCSNVKIIIPDHLTSWQAGNVWNSAYIDYITGLNPQYLRYLDLNRASENFEDTWADRVTTDQMCMTTFGDNVTDGMCGGSGVIPWEHFFDLANRTEVDPWINVPVRADATYLSSLATLTNTELDSGRNVYIEVGNEIWNNSNPWGDGTWWTAYLDHTKIEATCDSATNICTKVGHGFTTGSTTVRSFWRNGYGSDNATWRMWLGTESGVERIDDDTFYLKDQTDGTGNIVDVGDGHTGFIYVDTNEAGKTANQDEHYGEQCVTFWSAFDSALGASRVKAVMCSKSSDDGSKTAARYAVTGVADRIDYVSTAPYYAGNYWIGSVDIATTVCTPKIYTFRASTVYMGLYASGSTPTAQEVVNGEGTGFVSGESISASADTNNAFTQITSLTDDTNYELFFVVHNDSDDANDFYFKFSDTVLINSSTRTETIYDELTNYDIAWRDVARTKVQKVERHITNSGNTEWIAYEAGPSGEPSNEPGESYLSDTYQESVNYANVIKYYFECIAAIDNTKGLIYFKEQGSGRYNLGGDYSDTDDEKYKAFAAYNGEVVKNELVTIDDFSAADVETDPGSFPHVVHTFTDESLTYTVISDTYEIFDTNANTLRLTGDTNVDWDVPQAYLVGMEASNGSTSDFFTVSVNLGYAWFAADADFSFDSIDDSDAAAMNFVSGETGSLTGTTATASGGLWTHSVSGQYDVANTGESLTVNQPWLLAVTIDLNGDTQTSVQRIDIGGGNYIHLRTDSTAGELLWYVRDGVTESVSVTTVPDGSTGVIWLYYDGVDTLTEGTNQTSGNTLSKTIGISSLSEIIGIRNSSFKLGSFEFVSRSSMTLTEAKALVDKIQDHHSIA